MGVFQVFKIVHMVLNRVKYLICDDNIDVSLDSFLFFSFFFFVIFISFFFLQIVLQFFKLKCIFD